MIRQLRDAIQALLATPDIVLASNTVLTGFRPSQLSEYLELFWRAPQLIVGGRPVHFVGQDLPDAERREMARAVTLLDGNLPIPPPAGVWWHHLVYAYMIENTNAFEIFSRVVAAYANGETLPPITPATHRWLRVTEELFLTNWRQHSILTLASNVRLDLTAIRRNAYYRMLGMDLNHGSDDGRPYPFHKAQAANRDFPPLFEELLREAWKGNMNRINLVGPNATDDAAIRLLVQRIQEMLNSRRLGGWLSREEFDAVAMASWFHLTLEENTAIVEDLGANASSAAERLRSIGARVGMPPHSRADAYFRMAEPISRIVLDIENQAILATGVDALYRGVYANDMLEIITQWSIAAGRDIKEAVGVRGIPAPVGGPAVRIAAPTATLSGDGRARR